VAAQVRDAVRPVNAAAVAGVIGRGAGVTASGVAGAAIGFTLYPSSLGGAAEGTLSSDKSVSYHLDELHLTLTTPDADGNQRVIYDGTAGMDGYFRDKDGNVVGKLSPNGVSLAEGHIAEMKAGQASRNESADGPKEKTEEGAEDKGTQKFPDLPKDPDEILKQGYKETTHPDADKVGRREFENPDSGDHVAWDTGRPGEKGWKGKNHWHRFNPNSRSRHDEFLDRDGNPVGKYDDKHHIGVND